MSYKDYTVKIVFTKDQSGATEYQLPYVFHVSDPKEGMKATVIKGTRGDGSIIIPGGKKSQEIRVKGKLVDADGYKDLSSLIDTMKTNLTTDVGTLTMKYYDTDTSSWINNWSYTVRRIEEIDFPKSYRTGSQEYSVNFLVLSY